MQRATSVLVMVLLSRRKLSPRKVECKVHSLKVHSLKVHSLNLDKSEPPDLLDCRTVPWASYDVSVRPHQSGHNLCGHSFPIRQFPKSLSVLTILCRAIVRTTVMDNLSRSIVRVSVVANLITYTLLLFRYVSGRGRKILTVFPAALGMLTLYTSHGLPPTYRRR